MRIHSECLACLFDRAKFECDIAFSSEEEKLAAFKEIAEFASNNLDTGIIPALIGTQRGRIIAKLSGKEDFYKELKEESSKTAEKLLPVAEKYYNRSRNKIHALLKIAAAANSMEFGVRGHSFNFNDFRHELEKMLSEDIEGNSKEAENLLKRYRNVLYLLDNAGEVLFDKFIAEKLTKLGKKVIISPKSAPVINDITLKDLKKLKIFNSSNFKIVPNGAFVGISFEEAPKKFLKLLFNKKYLIFAKGMGNYETLSERENKFKGRLIYVLRAKCLPVASSIGVERGRLVVKAVI